jgi:uncharacterized delta-60 repeat protein
MVVDDAGNVYVTGVVRNIGTEYDMATLKYDAQGKQKWLQTYAGPELNYDVAKDIQVDADGNVYITGYGFVGETEYDIITVKYDPDGNELWTRLYDGPTHRIDYGLKLVVLPGGDVVVVGVSLDPETGEDCVFIRYDGEGKLVWSYSFNGPGDGADVPKAVVLDRDTNIIVAGYSRGRISGRDYFVIKLDGKGNQIWHHRYEDRSNGEDAATAMAIDAEGYVYVTGYSYREKTDFDFLTLKLDSAGQLLWSSRFPGDR